MVITPDRLSRTIGAVYAAASDPGGFNRALQSIRSLVNGSSGMLFTPLRDFAGGGFGFVDHVNPEFFKLYRAYYWDKDPWAREGDRKGYLATGITSTDEALITQRDLRKEEIYPDLLVPMEATRLCCSVLVRDEDAALPRTYLSIYRGPGSRPFGNDERRALELIGPHVLQSLRLAYRLEFGDSARENAMEALHALQQGVVLIGRERQIVFMNRVAESLCAGQRGLFVSKQTATSSVLRAASAGDDARLQCAIDAALRILGAPPGQHAPAPGPVVVRAMSGYRTLLLTVVPLPRSSQQRFARGQAMAIVFVEDPAARLPAGQRVLAAVFGLTPAECRIADALLAGDQPKAIAHRFGVSENTVRTQVKALYEKTGTRGVTALATLLARFTSTRAAAGPEPNGGGLGARKR